MNQHINVCPTAGVINQSIPLVLPIQTSDKEKLGSCEAFTLKYEGKDIAIMRKPEFYPHNKEERCCRQFGTSNPGHPYVKVGQGYFICFLLSGSVKVLIETLKIMLNADLSITLDFRQICHC